MKFDIIESFTGYQGEGYHTGKLVHFIRFAGCNLNCDWCDERFKNYKEINLDKLINLSLQSPTRNVILTGGEPSIVSNISILMNELKKLGFWIGVETNGSGIFDYSLNLIDYTTLSPKLKKHYKIRNRTGDELRVVNDDLEVKNLIAASRKFNANHYYLSPLEKDGNFNISETIKLLSKINEVGEEHWQISLQTHKLAGMK